MSQLLDEVGDASTAAREIEFPEKLKFLFAPARFKVLWGGRDGVKSWSIAQALLLAAAQRPLRVLCARELQKSIAESVHHLLEKQIGRLGLEAVYSVEKGRIYAAHGSEFFFTGLRDAHNLKSYESVDIAWVEEAANVSKRSWDMLIPTIRKPGSEIWVSFNPELEEDETYQRFVVHPPPGAAVVKTTYLDNRWLSEESQEAIAHMRATRPDDFLWIYGGAPKVTLDGAIYADELRALTSSQHITRVPYDPARPVHTYWDLGIADQTAIWFVQSIAFETRFIDFFQDRNKALPFYLSELQKRGYVYGVHNLPHDGKRRDLGTGKSIEARMVEAGLKVRIVPNIGIKNGMDYARTLFARAWFDEEKTRDGLNCLRRYRWKVDEHSGLYSKEPLHDDNSNGSDAFRMAAVGLMEPTVKREERSRLDRARIGPWS